MRGESSNGVGGLSGDDSVSEEAEEFNPVKPARSHGQPINHATNAGLRESRGEPWGALNDGSPAGDISGARGPGRQARQACSASAFATCGASESSEGRTGPTRPAAPPRLLPAGCAVAVGHMLRITSHASPARVFPWPFP